MFQYVRQQESELELEDELDLVMSSDIVAAQARLHTKSSLCNFVKMMESRNFGFANGGQVCVGYVFAYDAHNFYFFKYVRITLEAYWYVAGKRPTKIANIYKLNKKHLGHHKNFAVL